MTKIIQSPFLCCVFTHWSCTSVLNIGQRLDRIAKFIQRNIDKLLTHSLIEGDLHRSLVLKSHRLSVILNASDSISVQGHLNISLCEDLNRR